MSFTSRYIITLLSSIVRAALNFFVSIKVANFLMPDLYGQYQYILTIITAFLLLINIGSENAFFTFISEKKQHIKFYIVFFTWQFFQVTAVTLLVIFLNAELYAFIFKDVDVYIIVIAIVALFFNGTIQASLNHILESIRKTNISQTLVILVALLHLILIMYLINLDKLDIKILFQIILFEYFLYTIITICILNLYKNDLLSSEPFVFTAMFQKFYKYCKPLILLAFVGACYTISDRWLIQTFLGSSAQAYFAISIQFSTLSILLTSSIVSIFRKEISESLAANNWHKVRSFYQVISRNIFLITTIICSILFIYSDDVLNFFYGEAYKEASLIFKIIMLLPITKSTGTVYVSFLYATSKAKISAYISYLLLPFSICLSILFISDFGLSLDIHAMGIRLLITEIIYIVFLEYFICKYLNIDNQYLFKVIVFVCFVLVAYVIRLFLYGIGLDFIFHILFVSIFYILPIGLYLMRNLKNKLDFNEL
ncbi:oligosaccharide flippase family protein [Gammaproteobacteria bacterium]|nr:oligosaccharide flippase family protein [Gammaproteobacteria bacterium]MDC0511098.1 oligosaccharide flippase family protein [bacterium]